jgi:hypothetical protein
MKATGKILIAAVLSIFMVTLATESEARRGTYRGRGHLSRPGHFKSGHKRSFERGHYTRSPKHHYRNGYYGYGVKHRYGYKRSLYDHRHYRPRLYYGHGYRNGFTLHLGHGLYGRYGYGKYHPFRYPDWRGYFYNGYKRNRYFADYLGW